MGLPTRFARGSPIMFSALFSPTSRSYVAFEAG